MGERSAKAKVGLGGGGGLRQGRHKVWHGAHGFPDGTEDFLNFGAGGFFGNCGDTDHMCSFVAGYSLLRVRRLFKDETTPPRDLLPPRKISLRLSNSDCLNVHAALTIDKSGEFHSPAESFRRGQAQILTGGRGAKKSQSCRNTQGYA